MNDSLEALEELYFTLRRLRNALPDSAPQSEKDQLLDLYTVAQRSYFRAVQGVLQGDAALIASLTGQLEDAQSKIDGMIIGEENFAAALQLIGAAVHLGSSVASFFV